MISPADRFFKSIPDADNISSRDLVGFFVYHLTVEQGEESATANSIDDCFRDCQISPPKRTAAYLSEGVRSKNFVKALRGYRLQRKFQEDLEKKIGTNRQTIQTSVVLRKLESKVTSGEEKHFLSETIDCFEAGTNRAAIIMCWILTLDHLYKHVLQNHLQAFNSELSKVSGKKALVIRGRDDFNDIREGKFIELLRAAGIISNDVRKILDEKLGTRNTCAHPSVVTIKSSKVIEFIDDLVENVVLKF